MGKARKGQQPKAQLS